LESEQEDLSTSRAFEEVAVDLQYSPVKANMQMHHNFASDLLVLRKLSVNE